MTKFEIPEQVTKTLYVHFATTGWSAGEIQIYDVDVSGVNEDKIVIAETEITIDIPPMDLKNLKEKLVVKLRKQKDEINARYHMELKQVQDKIDNLLALEYQGE